MSLLQRSFTADPTHRKKNELKLKLFRENTVIGVRRCYTSSARLQQEKKEIIAFPPISKIPTANISQSLRRMSWSGQASSKSLQDMFFSLQISDTQRLSLHRHHSLKDIRPCVQLEDCHWNKPYQKISGQTDTQIKAHLKNNRYHRRVKRVSNEPDLGEENEYVLEHTESFLLKSRQKPAENEADNTSGAIRKPGDDGHGLGKDILKSAKAITADPWAETTYINNVLQSMQTDRLQEETERNANSLSDDTVEVNEDGTGGETENAVPDKHGGPTDLKDIAFEFLSDTEAKIIKGHIKLPYTAQKKVFMTYICGGYQDSHPERNALFEKAYPELYVYFKEKGFDFRLFDLRWGLKDGTSNDHIMSSLHLKTLKQCQESGQTSFFCFSGQKYDQIIIPEIIQKDVFETIKSTVELLKEKAGAPKQSDSNAMVITGEGEPELKSDTKSETLQDTTDQDKLNYNNIDTGTEEKEIFIPTQRRPSLKYEKDLGALTQWYRLDENCNPSVYRLQSISTFYGDIFSRDPLRRQQAKIKWLGMLQKLYDIFQEYIPLAIGSNAAASFFKTVVEQEIDQAFCVEGNPENHFHCFQRVITDIKYNLSSNRAPEYVDVLANKPEINKPLYDAQQNLIKGIYQRLRHTNIYESSVSWGRDGINPVTNRSHAYYLDRLCRDFQRKVTAHFNRMTNIQNIPEKTWSRGRVFRNQRNEEILEHAKHCHTLVKCFMGRETFLREAEESARSSAGHLIVLHGEQGSGKSSITAKVASLAKQWIARDLRIVTRFIGITGESRNIRLLLQSLCYQIADIYNFSTHFSEDLKGLINEFSSLLELAKETMPLMIILDGIDELSGHEANLSWLPTVLPQHIYFIVSTSTESGCASLKHLQKHSSHHKFLQIPPLSCMEVHTMIESWLRRDHRRLTSDQLKVLSEACVACPLPLFVLGSYTETHLWTSYASDKDTDLQSNISKMYSWILGRLERNHGEQVLKKTTSYISFSRNGIALEELLDLLSLDQAVMNEIKTYHGVTVSVFPEVLWLKLQNCFGIHLVEQRTDNTYVINFAHDIFRSTCINRYGKSKDYLLFIHSTISDYYLESRSCHVTSDHAALMMPLSWVGKPDSKTSHVFNYRKILGISHHLIHSKQISRLVTECLLNYEYLLHKAWATSMINIQDDLKAAINPERSTPDLILLAEVLHLSRDILLRDPCQLASQLMGRLHQIESSDKPVAPGDPRKYPFLPSLLYQCTQSSIPVFVPSFTCLLPPGGLLCETTAGHTDSITAVAEVRDDLLVVTASEDGTLKIWDLMMGKAAYTLNGVGRNIDSITVCMQNKIVAVTKNHSFQIWDLYKGKMLYGASDFLDVPILTSAMDGQLLLAFFDGSHLVKVYDLADSCKLVCQVDIPADETPVHKNHSILVSRNSVKDYILFAYRSGKEAMVLSAKRGAVVAKLTTQNPVASVQGVAATKEYFLVICRYPSLKTHDIVHIELFSVHTFAYIRTVKGCGHDFITKFTVNRQGSHVIAFSQLPNTNATEILVWNLETEDHKHMAKFSSVPKGGLCFDLRYCIAFFEGESFLRSWNLATRINDQSLTVNIKSAKKIDGIQEVITMKNFPRYAVCRSVRPGVITIWNIVKSKCKGSAVRVERGLVENNDVVLVRDMKLFILTDRGMASFTEMPRPIFQTLLTYDLLKKKYMRKQTGLYVIPCPKHEYRVLDGGLLLGLSENRDHFVIWDLDSGFIKHRVRPQFKDKPSPLDHDVFKEDLQKRALLHRRKGKDTAILTPWERRNETKTAKHRRHEREVEQEVEKMWQLLNEKNNAIDQYLLSDNEKVIVCSYYAHHLCVFSLETMSHLHTLEDRTSMLFLHHAAITYNGSFLVLSNYCDTEKISYVTLWDLQNGLLKKRLKNEPNVSCLALTDDASRIVFGVTLGNILKVWDPLRRKHKIIPGYENLHLNVDSKLQVIEGGSKAILLSGEVSLWDLDNGTIVSVFTPDTKICCLSLATDRKTILVGMSDTPSLITLKVASREKQNTSSTGIDLFGEESTSSEDESNDKDQPLSI